MSCTYNKSCRENIWKPEVTCEVHYFSSEDIKYCLTNVKLEMIGDSRMRQQYYALISLLNDNKTLYEPKGQESAFYGNYHNS